VRFRGVDSSGEKSEVVLRLVGRHAAEQLGMIEACSKELLAHGMFPHGSEGGNDLTGPGEHYLWAGDSKEVFRRFLRDFPVLPIPPTPPAVAAAPDYFDIPKTGHVLAAEEREREEAAERESARLAAEAAEDRLRRQRDQGKKVLRAEEEDDEDDSSSRKGSVFAEQLEDTRAHVLVAHAVCGVPPRRNARVIPPAPTKALGKLVLASRVANSSGLAPELPGMSVAHASTLPPVDLSWSYSVDQLTPATPSVTTRRTGASPAAAFSTPGPSSPLNLNLKLKAVSAAKIAPPNWSDYVSGYIERSNLALEEIVESEQLIQESHTEDRQYFYVGHVAKRKRKKESKKAFY